MINHQKEDIIGESVLNIFIKPDYLNIGSDDH